MIEAIIIAATAAAYRVALSATKKAPAGTMRAKLFVIMGGGGPGPAGEG